MQSFGTSFTRVESSGHPCPLVHGQGRPVASSIIAWTLTDVAMS